MFTLRGFILYVLLLVFVWAVDSNVTQSCTHLYEKGVESYLENNFEECIKNFEKAVDIYHVYTRKLRHCRLKCKDNASSSEPLYHVDIENLLFYEGVIRQTLCLIQCEKENPIIGDNNYISPDMDELFQENKPYEYLHLCYYQKKKIVEAASAAYTYLTAHPKDKIMENNLKQYLQMEGVDTDKVTNYETKDYVNLYTKGADAYINKDWKYVVEYMEQSLEEYLYEEDGCRAQCEGPFDHGWYPDFIPSISNHFTVVLKCKRQCKSRLTLTNPEVREDDLPPSHYHYLQYSYFKLGDLKSACQAVASYLLFYPDDKDMLFNRRYYTEQSKDDKNICHPREEALRYVQRDHYESAIMKFIKQSFKTDSELNEVSKKLTEKQY